MKATKLVFMASLLIAVIYLASIMILSIPGDVANTPGQNSSGQNNIQYVTLSLSEVAKHGSAGDCWMAINGKVYDVTPFVGSHPGGADEIGKGCGKDATDFFATKGGKGDVHSSTAESLLPSYYLGDIGQQVTSEAIGNRTAPGNVSAQIKGDDDDDKDDSKEKGKDDDDD